MTKSQTLKLIGLLVVIVTVLTLFNSKNDKGTENTTVALENTTAPVVKVHESNGFPKLDEILNDPRLKGATTGISIRNASTGEIVYSHLGDTRVHPASVMKLLTGATALETLGEDHIFKTELYTDGRISNGLLYGNLYLKGKGDPTLTKDGLNTVCI